MPWTRVHEGRQIHAEVPCPGDIWDRVEFYRDLSDHLHWGTPLAVTPQSAARVVGVLEAARASAEAGREVGFDDRHFEKRR